MHTCRLLFLLGAMLALTFIGASGVNAQSRARSVDDLARQADVVAVGRVSAVKSEWSADRTHILTRVTLDVQEYLKGSPSSMTVVITTLGGEVGEVGELYTHVPTFRHNENVVVFLKRSPDGGYRVDGGTQGKYSVEADPRSGVQTVAGQYPIDTFRADVTKAAR